MTSRHFWAGAIAAVALGSAAAQNQAQSVLDTDPLCISEGCVIVFDGAFVDIYDVVDPLSGERVPPGSPLIRRLNNPLAGSGAVGPIITGTLTPANQAGGIASNGNFGFDQDGDGVADIRSSNDTNGVLDASDIFSSVTLTESTRLVAADDVGLEDGLTLGDGADRGPFAFRSFFISSRGIDFEITAQVFPNGDLPLEAFDSMLFLHGIRTRGTTSGLRFGQRSDPRAFERVSGTLTLGEIAGSPLTLVRTVRPIRRRSASSVALHVQRFDYFYGTESLDPSVPRGELDFRIEFDVLLR